MTKPIRFAQGLIYWKCISRALVVTSFCVFLGLTSSKLKADIFIGSEAGIILGETTAANPSVYTNPQTQFFGGLGFTSASLDDWGSEVSVELFGNTSGSVATPFLRSQSIPVGINDADTGRVGTMAAYRYNGTEAATVTFDWSLTADLIEPFETAASVRAQAAFITDAEFYSVEYQDFFESSSTVEDSLNFFQNTAGIVDETGSISFVADPGQTFHLVTLLSTYGGRAGASADAFNTFTGQLSSSAGSISAVPEPSAAGALLISALIFAGRRRRRQDV